MSLCTISIHSVRGNRFRSIFSSSRRPVLDLKKKKSAHGGVMFLFASGSYAKVNHDPRPNVKCEIAVGLDGSMAQLSVFASLSHGRQAGVRKKKYTTSKHKKKKKKMGRDFSSASTHSRKSCKATSAQLCPNSLWNEDGDACVQGVFALSNSH